MGCIYCGTKTKVTNSRTSTKHYTTWRRRHCTECGAIFTSHESPDLKNSIRVKTSSNNLQAFERDKLFLSLYQNLSHRNDPVSDTGALIDTILGLVIKTTHKGSILATEIRDICASTLKNFDSLAHANYVAHHPNKK